MQQKKKLLSRVSAEKWHRVFVEEREWGGDRKINRYLLIFIILIQEKGVAERLCQRDEIEDFCIAQELTGEIKAFKSGVHETDIDETSIQCVYCKTNLCLDCDTLKINTSCCYEVVMLCSSCLILLSQIDISKAMKVICSRCVDVSLKPAKREPEKHTVPHP